jgi:hypothetical protein
MDELPVFTCYCCHLHTGNPHTSLDRRVVRRIRGAPNETAPVTLEVIEAQELFTYCTVACWNGHEPVIRSDLQLKSTYPVDGTAIPCSRCGAPIVRATPHVVYAVCTMRLRDAPDAYIGEVLQDDDYACLCSDCEAPGIRAVAEHEAERARAA